MKLKLVYKIISVTLLIYSLLFLVGCIDSSQLIQVTFRILDKEEIIEIEKNSVITKDIIPITSEYEFLGLYYDDACTNQYQSEPINHNVSLRVLLNYVPHINKLTSEEKERLIESYLSKFNQPINIPDEKLKIKYYLGKYSNCYVYVMAGNARPFFELEYKVYYKNNVNNEIIVYDYSFFSESVSVSCGDKYYQLEDEEISNLLTEVEMNEIYRKYIIITQGE